MQRALVVDDCRDLREDVHDTAWPSQHQARRLRVVVSAMPIEEVQERPEQARDPADHISGER